MTDLAAQFMADAGGSPASTPGASGPALTGLAAQFAADASGAPAPATPAPAKQASTGSELGRQLGLTARAGITGLTSLPAMAGDALNAGINKVFGTHLAPVSQTIQNLENSVGLPQPQNATERVVQDAASAMAGTAPSVAAGKLIAKAASPVAQAIGQGLQAAPGAQIAGSAGAGAGSGTARELGLNPAWQIGAAIAGGGAGVLGGSLATSAVRAAANRMIPAQPVTPGAAAARADAGVDRVINELGPQARQSFAPIENAPPEPTPVPAAGQQPAPTPASGPVPTPPPQAAPNPAPGGAQPTPPVPTASSQFGTFQPIKQRVAQTIMQEQDPNLDAAAVMRAQDFRDLGIQPTLGQITRDPMQYAGEFNLRTKGVGDALANRFNQQNSQLGQALNALTGSPQDVQAAGGALKSSLKSIDDQMSQQVSDAYAAARASSGKNLDVPLSGVAQDYAQVLNDFGDKVPSGVRNNFEQLGLMGGTQRKTFSIENAENLLKVINANQGNDQATNNALGQLRNSVKNAILSADDQGGVYAPARALAKQRFDLQDQVPALEAAASDSVNADDFVRKFVLNGKTDEVNGMAQLLQQHAPQAFQEARAQIGAQLAQKGFGQNVAGDAKFNPNPYMAQLSAFGPGKIAAFYTPDEINQLNAIGRVGAYMNSFPSGSPVNPSGTAAAIGSMVGAGVKRIPYVGGLIDNAQNRMFVNKALAGNLSDATSNSAANAQQRAIGALLLNGTPRAPGSNR